MSGLLIGPSRKNLREYVKDKSNRRQTSKERESRDIIVSSGASFSNLVFVPREVAQAEVCRLRRSLELVLSADWREPRLI